MDEKGTRFADIKSLMCPDSICIVGASGDPSKLTGMSLKYLLKHGYKGKIFPINPKYAEVQGVRCYPEVSAVPEPIDVALISLSRELVLPALEACALKGMKHAVVFTAGFAELGPDGKAMQDELACFCQSKGVHLCGPNTNGIINAARGAVVGTCAVGDMDRLDVGQVAVVSQSGGLGSLLTTLLQERGIGFSFYADVGNQADLELADFVKYAADDDGTRLVICTIEGLVAPERFWLAAELALQRGKPLVVLKSGYTELGSQAAASHTGALAGTEAFYKAGFAHYGMITVDTPYAAVDVAQVLLRWGTPPGSRVGVITNTGGITALVADLSENLGIGLPPLSERTKTQIRQMGGLVTAINPLNADIMDEFAQCTRLMLTDEQFDVLLSVMATPVPKVRSRQWAQAFLSASEGAPKPILVVASREGGLGEPAWELFQEKHIMTFGRYDTALYALGKALEYGEHVRRAKVRPSQEHAFTADERDAGRLFLAEHGPVLNEYESKRLLRTYGIPTTKEFLVATEDEAVDAAHRIGYPVAVKAVSSKIAHKTEAGGVKLGIASEPELRAACREITATVKAFHPEARLDGLLVQEMVGPGVEVAFGMAYRDGFPPIVMFGLGGLFVEQLKDVAFKAAPLGEEDALDMIRQSRALPLLKGTRGRPPADMDACVDILTRFSRLAAGMAGQIQEIDMNPAIILDKSLGAKVVDARVVATSGRQQY